MIVNKNKLLSTPLLFIIDVVVIVLSFYFSLLLRFDGFVPTSELQLYFNLLPLLIVVNLIMLYVFGVYKSVWEYASLYELEAIVISIIGSQFIIVAGGRLFHLPLFHLSVIIIATGIMTAGIGIIRLMWRFSRIFYFLKKSPLQKSKMKKVLIVGAGDTGVMLARQIQNNPVMNVQIIGFIDKDPRKHGLIFHGIPVLGNDSQLPYLIRLLKIKEIIIALPTAIQQKRQKIMAICENLPVQITLVPSLYSSQGPTIDQLKSLDMDELLHRAPVSIDLEQIDGYLEGKTVMVTGGGGFIGSELCRKIIKHNPRLLFIDDYAENYLFNIEMEMLDSVSTTQIEAGLLDIRNKQALEEAFMKYRPQVVFHAAAYKHVPMMERHPQAALDTNVIGTLKVAELADKYHVEKFIFISTDKAVNPTSVMGASKRIAELVIKDMNRNSNTIFSAVRFGNVLGSTGSVIPTFIRQINQGGPLTVTHPEITRYFMTVTEATLLVLQAGALAMGDEIFVLDMGDPVKIDDLARGLIKISGHQPNQDIAIVYTGLRPGEKLYEELFTQQEELSASQHERIFISTKPLDKAYVGISRDIKTLILPSMKNVEQVNNFLHTLLPEFNGTV